jgi:hypothetical protein
VSREDYRVGTVSSCSGQAMAMSYMTIDLYFMSWNEALPHPTSVQVIKCWALLFGSQSPKMVATKGNDA